MFCGDHLSTAEVLSIFSEEITAHQGRVTDTFDDGTRLFTRSILPQVKQVRPGDKLQGGVALKAVEGEVWLHPYVFRQVCRNGAIMAETLASRHFTDSDLLDSYTATASLREAVQACCAEEVFASATRQMRSAQSMGVDTALNLLPMLRHMDFRIAGSLLAQVLERFSQAGDDSRFGLMNAVTSLARDTRDPQLRWDLEELGGGIPALKEPTLSPNDEAIHLAGSRLATHA
jgi:hypothetical protein